MRKVMMALMAVAFLAVLAAARAEFADPTGEQVKAAAEDASKLKDLLTDASTAQASVVLLQAVQAVQQLELTAEQKKERVGELFAAVREAREGDAVLIISDVASRMNPELLPPVAAPGAAVVAQPALPIAQPLAPPVAPLYGGQ